MKTLACKDMGMKDDFVAKGMSDEEVMMEMEEHAKIKHPEMMGEDKMKMREKMKAHIKEAM